MAEGGTVRTVEELLVDGAATKIWLAHLEEIGDPDFVVALPENLAPTLLELAVPHEDIDILCAMAPKMWERPRLRWLLRRSMHSLVRTMGEVPRPRPLVSRALPRMAIRSPATSSCSSSWPSCRT
ncbi:acyltransferase domain-containing protein [Fodinicola feengrottensis]|uniref:acyltransferase domain-containing protein n=1 Tax=Fodinicola feengrottensis TaxID=435914 RepID=UPI0028BED51C|nr:acyltransferase domain-containing protein [Fodinicola feengrottensis]